MKRSPWGFEGASGQFEKRVTSGTARRARNASASLCVGARKVRRGVERRGKVLGADGMVLLCSSAPISAAEERAAWA
jgi:hypothetical protein